MAPRGDRALVTLSSMMLVVTVFLLATAGNAEEPIEAMTEDQRVSYTLGYMMMHRMASQGYSLQGLHKFQGRIYLAVATC